MHFSVKRVILTTLKGDTHQHNLTGNKQSLSFLPSYMFIIECFLVGRFCSLCPLHFWPLQHVLGENSCIFPWNFAVINCLSTVVITETSEGHMGCSRALFLLDKEIRIHFCHRVAKFWGEKGSLFHCSKPICVCFFLSFLPGMKPLSWEHEKCNTWYVSVNWREERESHMSTFSLQSSQNVYLSAFEDWNNPKRKFITELKFLGS